MHFHEQTSVPLRHMWKGYWSLLDPCRVSVCVCGGGGETDSMVLRESLASSAADCRETCSTLALVN